MKYAISVAGHDFEVEFDGDRILVDGQPMDAEMQAVAGTPLQQLFAGGGCRTVAVVRTNGGWSVLAGGEMHQVAVVDARIKALRGVAEGAGGAGGEVIRAPMPGMVLRLEVETGQEVAAGAGILVLEAMKMENEIRSRTAGVVTAIRVEEGEAVEKGVPLVEIGPPS